MRTEPLTIPLLAGPVVLTPSLLTNRCSVTVGGVEVKRNDRGTYPLPTASGSRVEATVRTGFTDASPTVEINGVKYRTGPPFPPALRVLSLIPLVLFALGGAVGGLLGALGVLVNLAVVRQPLSTMVKALVMVSVLFAAVLVWLLILLAIQRA